METKTIKKAARILLGVNLILFFQPLLVYWALKSTD